MIGQYFSQTNESATVPVLQNILELNKASVLRILIAPAKGWVCQGLV